MAKKLPWYRLQDWMINWMGFTFLFISIGLIYADVKEPAFVKWD